MTPYLFFNGRTEEALAYYKNALDAKVEMLMRFKDDPSPERHPPGSGEKIMHSCVRMGQGVVMMSDGQCSGSPNFSGFSLTYDAKDEADAKRRFEVLAKEGQVEMPLGETFFAKSFGAVRDKFGVSWMVIAGAKQ